MRRLVAHWWNPHPAVPNHDQLTLGERAADRMRLGMGSWTFVAGAVVFLAAWMTANVAVLHRGFDPYPFILLNLVLSCLAALQGAILLIAAKRSDQISAAIANHTNENTTALVEMNQRQLEILEALHAGRPPGGGQ